MRGCFREDSPDFLNFRRLGLSVCHPLSRPESWRIGVERIADNQRQPIRAGVGCKLRIVLSKTFRLDDEFPAQCDQAHNIQVRGVAILYRNRTDLSRGLWYIGHND